MVLRVPSICNGPAAQRRVNAQVYKIRIRFAKFILRHPVKHKPPFRIGVIILRPIRIEIDRERVPNRQDINCLIKRIRRFIIRNQSDPAHSAVDLKISCQGVGILRPALILNMPHDVGKNIGRLLSRAIAHSLELDRAFILPGFVGNYQIVLPDHVHGQTRSIIRISQILNRTRPLIAVVRIPMPKFQIIQKPLPSDAFPLLHAGPAFHRLIDHRIVRERPGGEVIHINIAHYPIHPKPEEPRSPRRFSADPILLAMPR